MLFNSVEFLFLFLPLTLALFFVLGRRSQTRWALSALILASLVYYGYWNPSYLFLIIGSILFNFSLGKKLGPENPSGRFLLTLGVGVNLGLLIYYKYTHFFLQNLSWMTNSSWQIEKIVLPLAISFFSFQQIAYLVDRQQGKVGNVSFLNYCLFVTFFPQLIAGPIVHHSEMMPQFEKSETFKLSFDNLNIGMTCFFIGLFKKVVIADELATYANQLFNASDSAEPLLFTTAWLGSLAYTFQLYFDFSGYSDMALGIGRMFGIQLPLNFFSPYKSKNIAEFWRTWHMTLSRFLRDYLYIPLGGNRKGPLRRYINLLTTMLLGGLWHGAGWNFVIWGGLHGLYLVIHRLWQKLFNFSSNRFYSCCSLALTFLSVVLAWVFFRSETTHGALQILNAMLLPTKDQLVWSLGDFRPELPGVLLGAALICFCLPNTPQWLGSFFDHKMYPRLEVSPRFLKLQNFCFQSWFLFIIVGLMAFLCLSKIIWRSNSEFIYFQF